MKQCTASNCSIRHYAKNYCKKHYQQFKKYGKLTPELEHYGLSNHSLYPVWSSMKSRCCNSKDINYKHYGGRGITVCSEWLNSFPTFLKNMGEKPTLKHSIDRIDNNKGYSKENCRWATHREQAINQGMRKDNTSGYKGVQKVGVKWKVRIKHNYKNITIGTFINKEAAIQARKAAELLYHSK